MSNHTEEVKTANAVIDAEALPSPLPYRRIVALSLLAAFVFAIAQLAVMWGTDNDGALSFLIYNPIGIDWHNSMGTERRISNESMLMPLSIVVAFALFFLFYIVKRVEYFSCRLITFTLLIAAVGGAINFLIMFFTFQIRLFLIDPLLSPTGFMDLSSLYLSDNPQYMVLTIFILQLLVPIVMYALMLRYSQSPQVKSPNTARRDKREKQTLLTVFALFLVSLVTYKFFYEAVGFLSRYFFSSFSLDFYGLSTPVLGFCLIILNAFFVYLLIPSELKQLKWEHPPQIIRAILVVIIALLVIKVLYSGLSMLEEAAPLGLREQLLNPLGALLIVFGYVMLFDCFRVFSTRAFRFILLAHFVAFFLFIFLIFLNIVIADTPFYNLTISEVLVLGFIGFLLLPSILGFFFWVLHGSIQLGIHNFYKKVSPDYDEMNYTFRASLFSRLFTPLVRKL